MVTCVQMAGMGLRQIYWLVLCLCQDGAAHAAGGDKCLQHVHHPRLRGDTAPNRRPHPTKEDPQANPRQHEYPVR